MKQKVIFIDWYGTLSESKFWEHLDSNNCELIRNSLFCNLNHLVIPWMRGEFTTEDIICQISDDSKLDHEFLLNELIVSCKNMVVPKSTLEIIKELRQKDFKVYIATDNMDTFSRWTAPTLNLENHFDGILNSSHIKALKGDFDADGNSLFFQKFFTKNSIMPNECILIDDSQDKGNRIQDYGIDYKKINKSPELESILFKLM